MFVSGLLKAFVVTARKKSLKNAAKELFITASPLSRRIKIFEDKLGGDLFIRGKDGVTLNQKGMDIYNAILPYYEYLISLENDFIEENNHNRKKQTIKKSLGILIDHDIPSFMSNFTYNHPGEINIYTHDSMDLNLINILHNSEIDAIISTNTLTVDDDRFGVVNIKPEVINIAYQAGLNRDLVLNGTIIITPSLLKAASSHNTLKCNNFNNSLISLGIKNVISMPEITSHLSKIEKGEVIGLVPSSMSDFIKDKFKGISIFPFLILDDEIKIERNVYFLKEKENIIFERLISKLSLSMNY
ncbi:LysR family transcriptional regulator [Yersinia pekkanenii]|uniref:LysR family transcriptional regulator n=1 Tax=Yersinia pekkanenii TaxID=1288385 RepID=A0A0T9Q9F0_9GAMM|nr:LysR family transcriptional regulator [Yersinia pekkanenii]CNI01933.1 putative LysR family transcriptional regulator [Yersinia pekkanenii]CRY63654.1 putative LysR family transcriptional regulator [Yersinia pekkanenii]